MLLTFFVSLAAGIPAYADGTINIQTIHQIRNSLLLNI
jgi:hypothetical protein